MSDTPEASNDQGTSVLHPFVESEVDPLPAVEPVRLRSSDSAPTMPDDIAPSDVFEVEGEAPVEGPVDDLDPVTAAEGGDDSGTGTAGDDTAADDAITLPRKPFLIGVAVVGVLLLVLIGLWQSAGSGRADVVAGEPIDTDDAVPAEDVDPPVVPEDTDVATGDETVTPEPNLADAPVPALPGSALQRIVVPGEAKFVSAIAGSVAVVGPFGQLAKIDPTTNTVVGSGDVAGTATRIMRTATAIWITNYNGGEIIRVDPASNTVLSRIPFPGPDGLAKDGGTLIVSSYDERFVGRLDPASKEITQRVGVGGNPTAVIVDNEFGIWAAVYDTGELVQIDPATFTVTRRVAVGAGPVGLALSPSGLWVANHEAGTVVKVDMATGEVLATVEVGAGPTEIVAVGGSMWVTVTDSGEIVQIDGGSGDIVTRTPVGGTGMGGGPTGISAASGTLWVAVVSEQSVVRVDPDAIG